MLIVASKACSLKELIACSIGLKSATRLPKIPIQIFYAIEDLNFIVQRRNILGFPPISIIHLRHLEFSQFFFPSLGLRRDLLNSKPLVFYNFYMGSYSHIIYFVYYSNSESLFYPFAFPLGHLSYTMNGVLYEVVFPLVKLLLFLGHISPLWNAVRTPGTQLEGRIYTFTPLPNPFSFAFDFSVELSQHLIFLQKLLYRDKQFKSILSFPFLCRI